MKEHIFTGIWVVLGLFMLKTYGKKENTIRTAFLGMASGGASLVILHYLGGYLGTVIPVNLFNTIVSLILGIPGVILIACVNMFM
ncbi:MAG: hypothetical protein E7508_05585 [Ruminococcus sp.]|nr:hypothetical protein [Ruminococcus sp.]